MRRAGFTMIELIFVIVILGILSAVALPKFIGVSEQAHEGKLKAYVGTLNRTVAPALWSKSLTDNKKGSIKNMSEDSVRNQITPPDEIDSNVTVSDCADANVSTPVSVATATVGTTAYTIGCIDGSEVEAPRFFLYRGAIGADGAKLLVGDLPPQP